MIKELLRKKNSSQTVFTLSDIASLSNRASNANLISAVSYYVKKGELLRLSKGLYALNKAYSKEELGNKLRTPSYISLYTVLVANGVVFQPYQSIFLISVRSQTLEIDHQKYIFRKIKDPILLNSMGIVEINGVYTATVERALFDKIYLNGVEYFDNLRNINWDFARKLNTEVYKSKIIKSYIENHA